MNNCSADDKLDSCTGLLQLATVVGSSRMVVHPAIPCTMCNNSDIGVALDLVADLHRHTQSSNFLQRNRLSLVTSRFLECGGNNQPFLQKVSIP